MHTQIIIHFANIFERANFSKLFTNNLFNTKSSETRTLTNNFCIMNINWNGDLILIREYCPKSRITIKKIHNKRTTYTEWRP